LQGCVNVLSAAGYGYRYVKKTDVSTAYYQVVNAEAEVVRMMFDWYTRKVSASKRLRENSINGGSQPAPAGPGCGRRCGACCAIPPIAVVPVLGRAKHEKLSTLTAARDNGEVLFPATVPARNDPGKSGSKFLFPR
jgi:hypothetical protein